MSSKDNGNTSSKKTNSSIRSKTSRGSSIRDKTSRGSTSKKSSGSSLKDKTSRGSSSGSSLSERSSRRSSRRRRKKKKKKNQIPYGIGLVAIATAIGLFLNTISSTVALYWAIGIAFGVILQRGRFCFTASMRDPYLTGSTSLTRAVLIAFAVTTIGFTAIKYGYFAQGLPIPGMGYVVPISFATIIGAFLFGIGMVIAGGCASGTLMRLGEGFQMQIISLTFFVIGSLWGAHDFGWWKMNFISKGKSVFLPDLFGWAGGLTVQLAFIFALYYIAKKYEEKN